MQRNVPGYRLGRDELPQRFLLHAAVAAALGAYQQLRPRRILGGLGEQLIEVGFAVADAHQLGLRAQRLDLGELTEAAQPLHALLLLDGQLLAPRALALVLGIARPALGVDDPQRGPLDAERQGVVQDQAGGLVSLGVDRSQAGGGRMVVDS